MRGREVPDEKGRVNKKEKVNRTEGGGRSNRKTVTTKTEVSKTNQCQGQGSYKDWEVPELR